MTATLATRPANRQTEAHEHSDAPTWQPSQWTMPFTMLAGQPIAEVMTVATFMVLAFRDGHSPDAPARRQLVGDKQLASLFAEAKEELAPAVDPRGLKAQRQALIDLPQEVALAEARLAEVQAKAARMQLDPTAGHGEKLEAQQAATAAEKHVAAVRGKQAHLERDMGQMQGGMARKIQDTCQRIVSESEDKLRKEMDALLRSVAERMGPDLTRLRDLHDALQAPQRQRAVDVLSEKLLHELQTA